MRYNVVNLDVHPTNACNLACEQCTHFSNYGLNQLYNPEDIEVWYKNWHERLFPRTLTISGGEPLINKKLDKILYLTRKYWPDSYIRVFSNGLLLHKNLHLLDIMRELQIGLIISHHATKGSYQAYDDKFFSNLEYLKEYTLKYDEAYIVESYSEGQSNQYKITEGNLHKIVFFDDNHNFVLKFDNPVNWYRFYKGHGSTMKPYNSDDYKSSWDNCPVYQTCFQLLNGNIYKCAPLAYIKEIDKKYKLSSDWEKYLSYKPLEPTASDLEINQFFNKKAENYCSMCPKEKVSFIPDKDPTKKINFYPKHSTTN